jgi:hypothetical protein
LADRSRPILIEGYAIVSADSMISDAGGAMDALKFDADQQLFWVSLDAAAAVAHGRHSAEGGPRAERPASASTCAPKIVITLQTQIKIRRTKITDLRWGLDPQVSIYA